MAQYQIATAYDSSLVGNGSISGEIGRDLDLSPIDPKELNMESFRRSDTHSDGISDQPSGPSTSEVRRLFSDYNESSSENLESPLKKLSASSESTHEDSKDDNNHNNRGSESVASESTMETLEDQQLLNSARDAQSTELRIPSLTSSPPLAVPLAQQNGKSESPSIREGGDESADSNAPFFSEKIGRNNITWSNYSSENTFEASFKPKASLDSENKYNVSTTTNNNQSEESSHSGTVESQSYPQDNNYPESTPSDNEPIEEELNQAGESVSQEQDRRTTSTWESQVNENQQHHSDSLLHVTIRKKSHSRPLDHDNESENHDVNENLGFSESRDGQNPDQGSHGHLDASHDTCIETTSNPEKSTQSSNYPQSSSSDDIEHSEVLTSEIRRSAINERGNLKSRPNSSKDVNSTSSPSTVSRMKDSANRRPTLNNVQTTAVRQRLRESQSSEDSLPHKPALSLRYDFDRRSQNTNFFANSSDGIQTHLNSNESEAESILSERSEDDYVSDVSGGSDDLGNAVPAPFYQQTVNNIPDEAQLSNSFESSVHSIQLAEDNESSPSEHDSASTLTKCKDDRVTESTEDDHFPSEEQDRFFPKTPRASMHSMIQNNRVSTIESSALISKFRNLSMTPGEHQRISLDRRMSRSPMKTDGNKMTLRDQASVVDRVQKENFGLQLKICMLQKQLESRSDERLQLLSKDNEELKRANAQMTLEIKRLRSQIEALEGPSDASIASEEDSDTFQLERGATYLGKEIANKDQTIISDLQNERDNLMKEIVHLRAASNKLLDGNRALNDEMVPKSEYIELQRRLENSETELKEVNTARNRQQHEIVDLHMKLDDALLDNRDLCSEVRRLDIITAQESIDRQNLENNLNVLFKKLKTSQQEIRVLNEESEFLKETLEDKENFLMDERAEFSNLQRYAEEAREGIIEYQEELKKEQDAKKMCESKMDTLQRDINTLKAALDAKSLQLDESVKTHNVELEEAKKGTHSLQAKLQSEQAQSESLKKDLEKIMHLLSNVDGLIQSIGSSKRSVIVKAVSKLCTSSNQSKDEISDLQSILHDKDHTIEERDQTLENLTNELHRVSELYEKERQLKQPANSASSIKGSDSNKMKALERELQKAKQERVDALKSLYKEVSKIMGQTWNENNKYLLDQSDSRRIQTSLFEALDTISRRFSELETQCEALKERLSAFTESVGNKMEDSTLRMIELERRADDVIQDQSRVGHARLKTENRLLKAELGRSSRNAGTSDAKKSPTSEPAHSRRNSLENVKEDRRISSLGSSASTAVNSDVTTESVVDPSTMKRWELRLRELERRLKLEREARIIERDGAESRLSQTLRENKELKRVIEQDKNGLRPALLNSVTTSLPQTSTSPPSNAAKGHPVPLPSRSHFPNRLRTSDRKPT